jgi:hypothetical protein
LDQTVASIVTWASRISSVSLFQQGRVVVPAPHLDCSQLSDQHQVFWKNDAVPRIVSILSERTLRGEAEYIPGVRLMCECIRSFPDAIERDDVSILETASLAFDTDAEFYRSLGHRWTPKLDLEVFETASLDSPQRLHFLAELRLGDRFDVLKKDGGWGSAILVSHESDGKYKIQMGATARSYSITPSATQVAPLGRGDRRQADLRSIARRYVGGCSSPEHEAFLAGPRWRASLGVGSQVDARHVNGRFFLGQVVAFREVPIASAFASAHLDGSGAGLSAAEVLDSLGELDDPDAEATVSKHAMAAAMAAGFTEPLKVVSEVRVSFFGCDEEADVWLPRDSPFLVRPRSLSYCHVAGRGDHEMVLLDAKMGPFDEWESPIVVPPSSRPEEDHDTFEKRRDIFTRLEEAGGDETALLRELEALPASPFARFRPGYLAESWVVSTEHFLHTVGGKGAIERRFAAVKGESNPLSPEVLRLNLALLSKMQEGLSGSFCRELFPLVIASARASIDGWEDKTIRGLSSNDFASLVYHLAVLVRRVSGFSEACKTREQCLAQMAVRYVRSDNLQRRMEGLRLFGLLAEMATNAEHYPHGFAEYPLSVASTESELDVAAAMTAADHDELGFMWLRLDGNWASGRSYRRVPLAVWVSNAELSRVLEDEEHLFEDICVRRPHQQLIKRSVDLIRFLAKTDKLQLSSIRAGWDRAQRAGEGHWVDFLGVLSEVAADLSCHFRLELLRSLRDVPLGSLCSSLVQLLYAIATSPLTMEADFADESGLAVLEKDPAEVSAPEVARLALYMLWTLTLDTIDECVWPGPVKEHSEEGRTAEVPPEVSFAAAEVLERATRIPKLFVLRDAYMGRCISCLKSGNSVPQALRLLQHLVETHARGGDEDEDELDTLLGRSPQEQVTRADVVASLEEREGLLEAFFHELQQFREDALACATSQHVQVLCPASTADLEDWQEAVSRAGDNAALNELSYVETMDPVNSLCVRHGAAASSTGSGRPRSVSLASVGPDSPHGHKASRVGFLDAFRSRLRFLRLILSESHLVLTVEQAIELWNVGVAGALSLAQRTETLDWFSVGIMELFQSLSGQSAPVVFHGDTVERLFGVEMTRTWFASACTLPAYHCVRRAFLFVNAQAGTSTVTASTQVVHSLALIGVDVIWFMALRTKSAPTAELAISMLLQLLGSLDPSVAHLRSELAHAYIHRCIRYIRGVLPSSVNPGPDLPPPPETPTHTESSASPVTATAASVAPSPSRFSSARHSSRVSYAVGEDQTAEQAREALGSAARLIARCVRVLQVLVQTTHNTLRGMVPRLVPSRGEPVIVSLAGSPRVAGVDIPLKGCSLTLYSEEPIDDAIAALAACIGLPAGDVAVRIISAHHPIRSIMDSDLGKSPRELGLDRSAMLFVYDRETAVASGLWPRPDSTPIDVTSSPAVVIAATPAYLSTLLAVMNSSVVRDGNVAPLMPLPFNVVKETWNFIASLPPSPELQARMRRLDPDAVPERTYQHAVEIVSGAVTAAAHRDFVMGRSADSTEPLDLEAELWDEADLDGCRRASIGLGSATAESHAVEMAAMGVSLSRQVLLYDSEAGELPPLPPDWAKHLQPVEPSDDVALMTMDRMDEAGDHCSAQEVGRLGPELTEEVWQRLLDPDDPAHLMYMSSVLANMLAPVLGTVHLGWYRTFSRFIAGETALAAAKPYRNDVKRRASPAPVLVAREARFQRSWIRRFVSCGGVKHLIRVVDKVTSRLPSDARVVVSGLSETIPDSLLPLDGPLHACSAVDIVSAHALRRLLTCISVFASAATIASLPSSAAKALRRMTISSWCHPSIAPHAPDLPPLDKLRDLDQEMADSAKTEDERERAVTNLGLADAGLQFYSSFNDMASKAEVWGSRSSYPSSVLYPRRDLPPDPVWLAFTLGLRTCNAMSSDCAGLGPGRVGRELVTADLPVSPPRLSADIKWGSLVNSAHRVISVFANTPDVLMASTLTSITVSVSACLACACLLDPHAAHQAMRLDPVPSALYPAILRPMRAAILRQQGAASTRDTRVSIAEAVSLIASEASTFHDSGSSSGVDPETFPTPALRVALSLVAVRPTTAEAGASAADPLFDVTVRALRSACLQLASKSSVDSLFGASFRELCAQIISSPVRESRESPKVDRVLEGALRILHEILVHGSDELRQEAARPVSVGGIGLVDFLLGPGLMEVPSLDELTASVDEEATPLSLAKSPAAGTDDADKRVALGLPLCKTIQSRKAAFRVLTLLVSTDTPSVARSMSVLHQMVTSTHKDEASHVSGYRYSPLAEAKSSTGFVGLVNPGCVCYMNALLQQLFMIEPFRYAILRLDSGAAEQSVAQKRDNLVFQLQRMFASLELGERRAFHPKDWCYAFKDSHGRPTATWMQMDAQEFLGTLLARLEDRLRLTPVDGLLGACLGGREVSILSRADGKGADRQSQPVPFVTISCQVRGVGSLHKALERYAQGDRVSDYRWNEEGEQEERVDVVKRTCLERLPHTIAFHLMRFELNYETFDRFKVNDRFEFPEEIDLFPYTAEGIAWKERRRQRAAADSSPNDSPDVAAASEEAGEGAEAEGVVEVDEVSEGGEAPRGEEDDEAARPYTPERPEAYYKYRLVGVVVHMGTADSGHYYSLVRERGKRSRHKARHRVSGVRYDAAASARENSRALRSILLARKTALKSVGAEADSEDDMDLMDEFDELEVGEGEEDETGSQAGSEGDASVAARDEEDGEGGVALPAEATTQSGSFTSTKTGTSSCPRVWAGRWYEFNDALVQPFDPARLEEEAFGSSGGEDDLEHSSNAYMLIYERLREVPVEAEVEEVTGHELCKEAVVEEQAIPIMEELVNDPSKHKMLEEEEPGVAGALVLVARGDDPPSLHRWVEQPQRRLKTVSFHLHDIAPQHPESGKGSIPTMLEREVLESNCRYIRQRHLFDPQLAQFAMTLAEQLVWQSRACQLLNVAPDWPPLSRRIMEIVDLIRDSVDGDETDKMARVLTLDLSAVTGADASVIQELARIRAVARGLGESGTLAFPPRPTEEETATAVAAGGESASVALRGERRAQRNQSLQALLLYAQMVWTRSRYEAGFRTFMSYLAALAALEPRLAGQTLSKLVPHFSTLKNAAEFAPGQLATGMRACKGRAPLLGSVGLRGAEPMLFKLFLFCPLPSVREGWGTFVLSLLFSTSHGESGRLLDVKKTVLEATTSVTVDDGTTRDVPVEMYVPVSVTAQTIERLVHPAVMDVAVAHWTLWGQYMRVLADFAESGRPQRELLYRSGLLLTLVDALAGRSSTLHGSRKAFAQRFRSVFHNNKTGKVASFVDVVRCFSTMLRACGHPGYYLEKGGMAETTLLSGSPKIDGETIHASRERASDAGRRLAEHAKGRILLSDEAIERYKNIPSLDLASGGLTPFTLSPELYEGMNNAAFWTRLVGSDAAESDSLALAMKHFANGARSAGAWRAPLGGILNYCQMELSEDRAGAVSLMVEHQLLIADGLVNERASYLVNGDLMFLDEDPGETPVSGLVQAIVEDADRFPEQTFEIVWVLSRAVRISQSLVRELAANSALGFLVQFLKDIATGVYPDMGRSTLAPIPGDTVMTARERKSAIATIRSTTSWYPTGPIEASVLRRLRMNRQWRAEVMLEQFDAAFAQNELDLKGLAAASAAAVEAADVSTPPPVASASEHEAAPSIADIDPAMFADMSEEDRKAIMAAMLGTGED